MIFVGYNSLSKGYRLYDDVRKEIIVSHDVVFDEHILLEGASASKSSTLTQEFPLLGDPTDDSSPLSVESTPCVHEPQEPESVAPSLDEVVEEYVDEPLHDAEEEEIIISPEIGGLLAQEPESVAPPLDEVAGKEYVDEPLYDAKEEEITVAKAFEDLLKEDEVVQIVHNDKCAGVVDRDALRDGDLSPMFKLVCANDNFVVEGVGEVEFEQLCERSQDKSPLKVLARKWDAHAKFFRASHRIQGIGEDEIEIYGTDDMTNAMCDPITSGIYDIDELTYMDACVWTLSNRQHGFDVPKNPELVKAFHTFLIPMSLTMEQLFDTIETLGCGMVHYPMVEKIRAELKAGFPENTSELERKLLLRERIKLFTSNCHILGDELEATLQGRTLKQFYHKDPKVAKQKIRVWFDEVKEKILKFTATKKPREFILGTGKVLASNESLIAHSISAFSGSSGSAVFLVDEEPGCFIGIHLSPGCVPVDGDLMWSIVPSHNLAGNTENKLYGMLYFRDILPKLDVEHVDAQRKKVLFRFLAYHMETILKKFKLNSCAEIQKKWLKNTVSYLLHSSPNKLHRNLEGVFDGRESYEQKDYDVRSWYKKWMNVIEDAGAALPVMGDGLPEVPDKCGDELYQEAEEISRTLDESAKFLLRVHELIEELPEIASE
ncbi:hypothetical protein L7F22_067391 [Adiantum nelumboides]|nr:hypothetical protein [Adiantum nelumboides]